MCAVARAHRCATKPPADPLVSWADYLPGEQCGGAGKMPLRFRHVVSIIYYYYLDPQLASVI
jgi:hypothetical protein